MARSATVVSESITDHMRREALDVLTMRWPAFYRYCDRDRMTDNFMEALDKALGLESVVMARGNAIVAFVKDADFSPMQDRP